jgi:alpha-ribazole phosphatase
MEVYLIRHTTPAVAKGTIYGRTDVPLADTFYQEKDVMLKRLPAAFDAVYTSPSTRCTLLAAHLAPAFKTDERLYELHFGLWEGKTWDSIDRKVLEPWMQDYVRVCPPQGESMMQMNKRVLDFWQELRQQPHQRIAIVTHGGVIRLILAAVHHFPLTSCFDIAVSYGGIFHLQDPDLNMNAGLRPGCKRDNSQPVYNRI